MKKIFTVFAFTAFFALNAQETANRFFYELTFKPKKDSVKLDKVMTILDITKDKSIYRDYTSVAQDSIAKIYVEEMKKSGVYKDPTGVFTTPKFSFKVEKSYPEMKETFVDQIINGFSPVSIGYLEEPNFNWNISLEKEKIGDYNTQKATIDFGGRKWTAWFSSDIPLQDGPYKFKGLPGLIVKVVDSENNYSWVLKGNKKVENFEELSYLEKLVPGSGGKLTTVSREKFESTFSSFKKDPFSSIRPMLSQEMLSQKVPGTDITIGDMVKKQEKSYREFFNANNNPIEIQQDTRKNKE
ncbi:GLPGLI family protein [Chryseobacterium gotjawalense]|uniref:GLPGLI family protein n=1 Tax=Chryseobacterium gotjawalense TaxID=3042315 RepID=A0ABY8RAC8_9FLAO|nr:GLPGLI family protein [Chryseobacterium sp. wdc7]WHF50796.1 GLPGLI family protein [Chryseobacterium sp. wdc7]